jgi:hypothetical protein
MNWEQAFELMSQGKYLRYPAMSDGWSATVKDGVVWFRNPHSQDHRAFPVSDEDKAATNWYEPAAL